MNWLKSRIDKRTCSYIIIVFLAAMLLFYFFHEYWLWIVVAFILLTLDLIRSTISPPYQFTTSINAKNFKRAYNILEKDNKKIVKFELSNKYLAFELDFLSHNFEFTKYNRVNYNFSIQKLLIEKSMKYNPGETQKQINEWFLNNKVLDEIFFSSAHYHEKQNLINVVKFLLQSNFELDKSYLLNKNYATAEPEFVNLLVTYGFKFKLPENIDDLMQEFCDSLLMSDFDRAQFILDSGFPINFKDNNGRTILHKLCYCEELKNSSSEVESIIRNIERDGNKNNAFYKAIKFIENVDLKFKLDHPKLDHPRKNTYDNISNIVRFLTDHGADLNALDNNEQSPLYILCDSSHNYYYLIACLIEHGADINSGNSKFKPLDAILYNTTNKEGLFLASHFLTNGVNTTCLPPIILSSAIFSNVDTFPLGLTYWSNGSSEHTKPLADLIELIVKNGYPVNKTRDHDSTTLLDWVLALEAPVKSYELIELIIQHGADVDKPGYQGHTPLCKILRHNHGSHLIQLLINHGANVNTFSSIGVYIKNDYREDFHGKFIASPLHLACNNGDYSSSKLLVTHGANVNAKTRLIISDGRIPTYPHQAILDDYAYMKSMKNMPHAQIHTNKYTPLHYACHNDNLNLIILLIENSAEVNASADNGITPLSISCWNSNNEAIKCLIEHGADVNITFISDVFEYSKMSKICYPIKVYLSNCLKNKKFSIEIIKLFVERDVKFYNEQDFDYIINELKKCNYSEAKIIFEYLSNKKHKLLD